MNARNVPRWRSAAFAGLPLVAAIFCSAAPAQICDAQDCTASVETCPGLSVPGYGPGIAIHVSLYPIMPVCEINVPCSGPYAGARVQLLDAGRHLVAQVISNAQGHAIIGIAPGDYIIHIDTGGTYPRCPEASVNIAQDTQVFKLVQVQCDTGMR